VGAVGYMQHFGVDLAAKKDTEVFAINDGRVVLAENLSNYGKTIIIDHGLGIFSLYLHLDNFDVSVDQLVKNGQKIGLSGDTGASTGPHLHFSIRNSGSRVDPLLFIQTASSI
jgi:murein DD-endopeptidase MepM/ murein hydrolase activator NlpD